MRGGKTAKKMAKFAVARTMAVTIIAQLKDPTQEYATLSEADDFLPDLPCRRMTG